jgi:DNA-binding protein HU-beta
MVSVGDCPRAGEFQMAKPKTKSTKKLTKGALILAILESMGEGWARKDVKKVLDALTDLGHKELKKRGEFVLPGFAKFVVVKKPARPAREGINPFTKEPTTFAAKPASKAVKARPVKAIKDAIV